jgi:hypothetical protein
VPAKDRPHKSDNGRAKPLLMVDIDGVVSLFGNPREARAQPRAPGGGPPPETNGTAPPEGGGPRSIRGSLHSIEGIPHFLSATAAAHLLALSRLFELVWASGWEERANEHLPHLLGLPAALPFLRFSREVPGGGPTQGHWKLGAIDAFAGRRPLAWIDDALDGACRRWAEARPAPTLLVQTEPAQGLTSREARLLERWARGLGTGTRGGRATRARGAESD